MNILEENLPFLVIGVMIIVIVVLAYYTFIKPKPKNNIDEPKESEIDQAIINQDSDHLDHTSKALGVKETSDDEGEENQESNELDASKPIVVQTNKEENDSSEEDDSEVEEKTEKTELGKYHITYREKDNKWIVIREGSDKTIRVLHTKKEAIAYATIKAINQDSNIVIHGRDGKIEKHGY